MNKNKIQLELKDWKILKDILSKYPYTFYAYGSRVKKNAKPYSDLDLCYFDVPWNEISNIREELTKSDLPFFIELVNWKHMTDAFRESIRNDLIPLAEFDSLVI